MIESFGLCSLLRTAHSGVYECEESMENAELMNLIALQEWITQTGAFR